MIEQATKSLGIFSDAVRLAALLLLSVMFSGAGAMLAAGGRPEAILPLLLAAGAISQLPRLVLNLYRDLTGNY
ncbi:MAG: hypothetical protein RLO80_03805 [Hyphomonas sp.]